MARYNTRLITARRSYSMSDICALYKIDRKTCHFWITNKGLKVIEKNVIPLLIMGQVLIDFLKKRARKRRVILKHGEFFCMKCQRAVTAKQGTETSIETGMLIGKGNKKQRKKTGICESCGTKVNRFLSAGQKD